RATLRLRTASWRRVSMTAQDVLCKATTSYIRHPAFDIESNRPGLFAESEHKTGRRFRPRQGVVTEVRESTAPDVHANTHGAPEPRGFNSDTIVDTEKCAVVGHDDFSPCIDN